MVEITGETRVFGILADPIAQVRTPQALNARFATLGADAVLVPFHVAPADVRAFWTGIRGMKSLDGFIVTTPHKATAVELADEVSDAAARLGAANVVRRAADGRFSAAMYDGIGFVAGLKAQGHDPAGRRVLVAGAGGAAAAIAFALADAGIGALHLANRTSAKAEELAARVRAAYPALPVHVTAPMAAGVDIAVNATTLGMRRDDPLPIDLGGVPSTTLIAEIIMKPEKTALLLAAERAGCPIHYGRHMLDEQLALMLDFLGVRHVASMPLPKS